MTLDEIGHDDFVGGRAQGIGIFLSVLNVHVDRVPCDARGISLHYRNGTFVHPLRPESERQNEALEIRLEEPHSPDHGIKVRQIAGAIARGIVCWVAPGDPLARGERCGMIKRGSRTELIAPSKSDSSCCSTSVTMSNSVTMSKPAARLAPAIIGKRRKRRRETQQSRKTWKNRPLLLETA